MMQKQPSDRVTEQTEFRAANYLVVFYRWATPLVALALIVGLVHIAYQRLRGGSVLATAMSSPMPTAMLLALWTVPVASILTFGAVRLLHDKADSIAWLAVGIGVALISIWVLT